MVRVRRSSRLRVGPRSPSHPPAEMTSLFALRESHRCACRLFVQLSRVRNKCSEVLHRHCPRVAEIVAGGAQAGSCAFGVGYVHLAAECFDIDSRFHSLKNRCNNADSLPEIICQTRNYDLLCVAARNLKDLTQLKMSVSLTSSFPSSIAPLVISRKKKGSSCPLTK